MRFIHIADVHLGARPDMGKPWSERREKEIWDAFERIIRITEQEKVDLLLIAGDLFHGQPLMRELKEVDYLFSTLTHTRVVLIAGNHDYLKPSSHYDTFEWNRNVTFLKEKRLQSVYFKEFNTRVFGLSYYQKEIAEPLYEEEVSLNKHCMNILLAHGGDVKHIPIKPKTLASLGYDYIALGHIHQPGMLLADKIAYAGALEPIDCNDLGPHGYIFGKYENGQVQIQYLDNAIRSYIHLHIETDIHKTNRAVRQEIIERTKEMGLENMYKITLEGFRDTDIIYDLSQLEEEIQIVDILDYTEPDYDFDKLMQQYGDSLVGRYITSFSQSNMTQIQRQALYYGVHALLESKR